MRPRSSVGRWCFPFLLAALLAAGLRVAGGQEIAPARTVLARPTQTAEDLDQRTSANNRLDRMILLLQPSAKRQKALDTLLAAQMTPGDPRFHQWVAPEEFADKYALSAADIETVVTWLQAQGFRVAPLPAGRGWLEFSGTAGRVERAFGQQVRAVPTGLNSRLVISGDIQLPAEIAPLVKGLVSLDRSWAEVAATSAEMLERGSAATTLDPRLNPDPGPDETQAVAPAALGTLLHIPQLTAAGVTGAGESIAVVSRSSVRPSAFDLFREKFGLPTSTLEVRVSGGGPGQLTSDEAAATQAVSWAGVAAPGAHIVLVTSPSTLATDGFDLALAEAIDGSVAHTVSVGYTYCESSMSAAHLAFYAALYRQAAAEGISIIAASGDSGAAACHRPDDTSAVSSGWGVNGLASTPWNTAVGAAELSTDGSVVTPWETLQGEKLAYATGGGASSIYAAPAWQSALGMPANDPVPAPLASAVSGHHRYLPDLSLPAALSGSDNRGLMYCFSNSSVDAGCGITSGGGSSVSAAIFAGISALLAHKYGPQGNLAPNLYAQSRFKPSTSSEAAGKSIVDITAGGAKLPCVPGSPDCVVTESGSAEIGFAAAAGYDLASGLGTIDAQALVENWASTQASASVPALVEMTNTADVTYNPSDSITLGAEVSALFGGAPPTGTVQFYDKTTTANVGTPVTISATGAASYTETGQFTPGGHDIEALYSGDSTYEASFSMPVEISVEPSPTALTVVPSTTVPGAGSTFIVTGTVTSSNPGTTAPTGTLTVNVDGISEGTAILSTTGTGTAAVTSAAVSLIAPAAGIHAIQGMYSGDVNYNASTSPSVAVTIVKTVSATTLSASPSTLALGIPETLTAVVGPAAAVTGTTYTLTGTVSFYDGATLLGTVGVTANTAVLSGVILSAALAHTITAVYSGDANYTASTSAPVVLQPILLPVTVVLTSSSAILAPGQSANLTATVTPINTPLITAEQNPTGTVYFYAGTTLLGSAPLVTGVGDSSVARLVVPVLPPGTYVLTAVYAGDTTYGTATSNTLNLGVEDFTISCSPNSTSVVQGQAVSVTCTVASLGGFTGPIQVACAEQNPPQVGAMGCSFNPDVLDGNASTTMTVTTTAGNVLTTASNSQSGGSLKSGLLNSGLLGPNRSPLWPAGGAALALAGFLLSPFGKIVHRARLLRRVRSLPGSRNLAVLLLLLAGLASAGIGCTNTLTLTGSGGNLNNTGTPLGVHTIKVTAAANLTPPTVTVSHYTYVTINVTPISGQ